jgi:hypothetical protein
VVVGSGHVWFKRVADRYRSDVMCRTER